uniref:Putative ovule protein n=1 Tax=Solanum chacoense TaxID=4108 RepID=A0A0V0HI57_SOLCH
MTGNRMYGSFSDPTPFPLIHVKVLPRLVDLKLYRADSKMMSPGDHPLKQFYTANLLISSRHITKYRPLMEIPSLYANMSRALAQFTFQSI